MNDTELYPTESRSARIEIIPLIDVVFFLLATFVLFTLSLDRITALKVDQPVPGIPPKDDNVLYLQASEAGIFYWKEGLKGTPVLMSRTELPARLDDYRRQTALPRVMVRGDRYAKFGDAVALFDEVRRSGIRQVSIETIPSSTGT